ncbi:MAG: hypothetical protein AAGU12_08005 [Clostridiales bacterium]
MLTAIISILIIIIFLLLWPFTFKIKGRLEENPLHFRCQVRMGPFRYTLFPIKSRDEAVNMEKAGSTAALPAIRYLAKHISIRKATWQLAYSLPDAADVALSGGILLSCFDLAALWLQAKSGKRHKVVSYSLKPGFGGGYSLSGEFLCMLRLNLGHIVVSLGIFMIQQRRLRKREGIAYGTASY